MIKQPSQQRIAGGARAGDHSRTSSLAALLTDNARRLDIPPNSLTSAPNSQDGYTNSSLASPAMSLFESSNRSALEARAGWPFEASATGGTVHGIGGSIPQVGFPPRPGQFADDKSTMSAPTRPDGSIMTKGNGKLPTFEPPPESLLYPQNKTVGYTPWLGNHPEDNLNEQTIKTGFQNKPSTTTETNTARPSLWPHLKNWTGLQTLSFVLGAVLDKRQTLSRANAISTFKPPPRVSLTNTKREAWLSDLSNPACTLRRFNRTIPYGINGKMLLEQCLSKEIPTARAIWLAKCIGANELRTLKRKVVPGANVGISAELKWIREWTMHVEQFVEATLSGCGEQAWKEKIQYVVRLIYHLFLEQLLDHDHFLDWILASFESSTSERLPLWLIHIQLYWKFLVNNRRRGRRLAETLCTHLHVSSSEPENSDLLKPVVQKLQILISILAASHRGCLIMPKDWCRFESIMRSIPFRPDLERCITNVLARNDRITKPSWRQGSAATSSPRRRTLDLLDEIEFDVSIPDICSRLSEINLSIEDFVSLVLEWCSSLYRQGAYRIYLASRILRRCRLAGVDIETCILGFLTNPPNCSSLDERCITKVVAELVRSKQFAASRVLQSVIARGAMTDNEYNPLAASRLRQLVQDIPTAGLPQHVGDLQRILLRQAGCSVNRQDEAVAAIERAIQQSIAKESDFLWSLRDEICSRLQDLTLAGRFRITSNLRGEILRRSRLSTFTSEDSTADMADRRLTCHAFYVAREVLESLEDYAILADVVAMCISKSNGEMLTSAIDTIRYHRRKFAAIGALRSLSKDAIERYRMFRNEMPLEKSYISSLLDLVSTSGDEPLLRQLKYDLARCDQRNTMAMCSPASDNALDIIATSAMDSDEEIERILSSGTTMDEHSLGRVFQHLATKLANPVKAVRGGWLSRLRSFDESTFDGLMNDWLSRFLLKADAETCCDTLSVLLGAEGISFTAFEQLLSNNQQQLDPHNADSQVRLASIAMTSLLLPNTSRRTGDAFEHYTYKLEQRIFCENNTRAIFKQIKNALILVDDDFVSADMVSLQSSLQHPTIRDFLLSSAIKHKQLLQSDVMSFVNMANVSAGCRVLTNILDNLLDPKGDIGRSNSGSQSMIPQLIRMAGDLSLPICQLEMQLLLNGDSALILEPSIDLASSLFDAIMWSPDSNHPPWINLLDGLDVALLQRLRTMAESRILDIVSELSASLKDDPSDADNSQPVQNDPTLQKLLYIVDCTVPTPPSGVLAPTSMDAELAPPDHFSAIKDVLARHFLREVDGNTERPKICGKTVPMLDALLRLLAVKKLSSDPRKVAPSDAASVLPILFSILTQNDILQYPRSCELLYDTAIYLSDDLSDDLRALLIKSEFPKYPRDPRISFILGPQFTGDAWLGLVTTNHTTSASALPTAPIAAPTPIGRFGMQQQQGVGRHHPMLRPPTPQWPSTASQEKNLNSPVPYALRPWELLPDQGSNTTANDTSISLALMGARKV